MMLEAALREVDQQTANEWITSSLQQGHELSAATLEGIDLSNGHSRAILPTEIPSPNSSDFRWGMRVRYKGADRVLSDFLLGLARKGDMCLVVEDEFSSRGDAWLSKKEYLTGISTGYVDDHVLHWSPLDPNNIDLTIKTIEVGSHGYPRNCFVASVNNEFMNTFIDKSLHTDVIDKIAESIVALVIGAFDDESYVVWEPRSTSS